MARDRLAQRRLAGDLGIVGAAAVEAVLGGGHDRRRGREVGVADGQQDDVLAGRAPPHRLGMDVPGGGLRTAEAATRAAKRGLPPVSIVMSQVPTSRCRGAHRAAWRGCVPHHWHGVGRSLKPAVHRDLAQPPPAGRR